MNKICIVTPSLRGGGAEKVAVNLANQYADDGYLVDLVVINASGPYLSLVGNNVNLINFNVSRIRLALMPMRRYLFENQSSFILSVIRDVNILVGLASLGLSIRFVFREASTLNIISGMSLPNKILYKFLMIVAYRRAHKIIANSDDTKDDLLKFNIVKQDQISVIGNPVLPLGYESLINEDVSHPWFENQSLKVILSVGRLHESKNYPFLISVFSSLFQSNPNLRLMIVGEGPKKNTLIELIQKNNLSSCVQIIDFQNNVFPYYKNADLFALTSSWEGFGNVLVEALSSGLPVVSTNCHGGPKMILEYGKYGKLIEVGDEQGFIAALEHVLENPAKSLESIEYAKKYSTSNVAEFYLLAFNQ